MTAIEKKSEEFEERVVVFTYRELTRLSVVSLKLIIQNNNEVDCTIMWFHFKTIEELNY